MPLSLYSYFRSSAAWRVRIALAMKQLPYTVVPVNLRGAGEQNSDAFRARNPQGLVPFLEDGDTGIAQSLAICEYLEERYPQPPLLPAGAPERAWVRSLVLAIACDIHPLNNLRVLNYLKGPLGLPQEETDRWYRHWITVGFTALEQQLQGRAGPYCAGAQVTLADVFLVPQVFNARRLAMDVSVYPRIHAIDAALVELPAFEQSAPRHQPDAV